MQIQASRCTIYYHFKSDSYINLSALIIIFMLFSFPFNDTMAQSFDGKILQTAGGQVISVFGESNHFDAMENIVSLFAVPDEGYRFGGWENSCADTPGLLCTKRWGEHSKVSARFIKTTPPKIPIQVLLLLQNRENKPSIWNDFVERHFHNRCPEIYGGMVLGKSSFNPENKTYCYRLRFGYYDAIAGKNSDTQLNAVKDKLNLKTTYEVSAALLGILNRHQKVTIAFIAQADTALATKYAFNNVKNAQLEVTGLVSLQNASFDNIDLSYALQERPVTADTDCFKTITLSAKPKNVGKISKALAQLPKSWWQSE